MTDEEVNRRLAAAVQAQRAGRHVEATQAYHAVLAERPDQPQALNALGVLALARGEPAVAAPLFASATTADPASPDLWMNLARARREMGDAAGEERALEGALAIDQRHFLATVRLAELHERLGRQQQAAERWGGVLAMSGMFDQRTPQLDALFAHAGVYVAAHQARFGAAMDEGLAEARAALAPVQRRRFDVAVDASLGRRRIYANDCQGLHFPFLPAEEWFDRSHFPWMSAIEAHTSAIRAELESLLEDGGPGIEPYVAMAPGTPENKWTPLDNSLAWGAFHLWRHGTRVEEACARCPRTAAALAAVPQPDMPGRTPTAFFSLLKPRTRIPPHGGVSNVRATVHLPLIVPEGCGFRVGGETRPWRVGEAIAFDDTIEHEAWNDSDALRAVLIFDVWNPHLTGAEQSLLRAFYAAADAVGFDAGGVAD